MTKKYKKVPPKWTDEQIAQLKKLSKTVSAPEIARMIGKTRDAVKNKIERLGLPKFDPYAEPETEPIVVAPEPVQASSRTIPAYSGPPLRKKEVRGAIGTIEWCGQCGSPVSNWTEHADRLGHRRPA